MTVAANDSTPLVPLTFLVASVRAELQDMRSTIRSTAPGMAGYSIERIEDLLDAIEAHGAADVERLAEEAGRCT